MYAFTPRQRSGSRSIATTISEYNGGAMPEMQADLDRVLTVIPETTRKPVPERLDEFADEIQYR